MTLLYMCGGLPWPRFDCNTYVRLYFPIFAEWILTVTRGFYILFADTFSALRTILLKYYFIIALTSCAYMYKRNSNISRTFS